ncbi:hypothetical protein C8Q80DRAFT_1126102 [Daedaleopsis nitida]|nr:hypothetical protein C8Q80DRAFT_1126102 [Daedaleopsis nitida]
MPKMSMTFEDPWLVTVVRTRGLDYIRPEKAWRPIVTLSVLDGDREHGLPHEVVLGSDGQNPNLKSVIPIDDVNHATRLVIHVHHRSRTSKKPKHRKHLVGSATLSLNEFLNKHPLPHPQPVEYDVRLSCPPPQRKSRTINGKQQHTATLTMRFSVPRKEARPYQSPPMTPISEHPGVDEMFSDGASSSKLLSETMVEFTPESTVPGPSGVQLIRQDGSSEMKRRKTKKKNKLQPFRIDSDSDAPAPTPRDEEFLPTVEECAYEPNPEELILCAPSLLPTHSGEVTETTEGVPPYILLAEAFVDHFAPCHELREAEKSVENAEKVLGRLLTEWYVVGASLLALAGIDAAVFGFGSDALFAVHGFSKESVSLGGIAAGIGLVFDAWFLVRYGGANVQQFQARAKDVYNSYFFFCLQCRLPTVCMFLSALALMAFLFAAAWTAWPTAVLVMSFVAGLLFTSQFLVFGVHTLVNWLVWTVRVCYLRIAGTGTGAGTAAGGAPVQPQAPAANGGPEPNGHARTRSPASGEGRVEMPVPSPSPAPKLEMVWSEEHRRACEDA